jgi:hypothetical protein
VDAPYLFLSGQGQKVGPVLLEVLFVGGDVQIAMGLTLISRIKQKPDIDNKSCHKSDTAGKLRI